MKTRNLLILLPIVALTLGSCAKIKEALVVKKDVTFTVDLPVSVSEPLKSTGTYFNVSRTFDPIEDATVASVAPKLESLSLNSLTITMNEISDAPVTLRNSVLSVMAQTGEGLFAYELDGTYNDGFSVTITGEVLDRIEDTLSDLFAITVYLQGFTDKSPVSFTLSTILDTEVSVRIIGEE
jgi:hypothetical protein